MGNLGSKGDGMYKVIGGLENSYDLSRFDVLDMFAGDGTGQLIDYYDKVRSVEAWEIDENKYLRLKHLFTNILSKNVDSWEEIENIDRKFDMIVVDHPIRLYNKQLRG